MQNSFRKKRRRPRRDASNDERSDDAQGSSGRRGRRGRRKPRPIAEGTITRIATQRRNTSRVSIYIDNEFAFGLVQDIVLDFKLCTGQHLTVKRQEEVLHANAFIEARSKALEYISYKPRSEQEVRDRLRKKEFHEAAIEAAITRLRELGYLNDASYAEAFVRDRLVMRRYGMRRIRQELKQRGVDEKLIRDAVEPIEDDQVLEAAQTAAAGRWKSLMRKSRLTNHQRRQKLYSFLARRGFGSDVVRKAIEKYKHLEDEMAENEKKSAEAEGVDRETALAFARKRWQVLLRLESNGRKRSQKLWDHLRRKGISTDMIRDVASVVEAEFEAEEPEEEEQDDEQLREEVMELARKRWRVLGRLESNQRKRVRKLEDFLRRRSVAYELISDAVDTVMAEG